MEIENVLNKLSEEVGKSPKYLKGLFNSSMKEYNDQFGDSLTDKSKNLMAITKIGKKYDLDKSVIEGLTTDVKDVEKLSADGDFSVDGFLATDDPNFNPAENTWERFLSTIPDPTKPKTSYVKVPSLIIELGPTYYIKLTNPKEVPFSKEFEGHYGKYMRHAFKITFVKVSDEDMYEQKYEKGDFAGQPAFVDGNNYTLWLDDKSVGFFRIFWNQITDDGIPDDRVFTYKYTKKGNYNVYTYKLPKK